MKQFYVFIFLFLGIVSCGSESQDITKAKQELGVIEKPESEKEKLGEASSQIDVDANNQDEKAGDSDKTVDAGNSEVGNQIGDKRIQINYISGKKVLELDKLSYKQFKEGYSKITGKTLSNVSNITITFSNDDSDFPNDTFTLKKFVSGDLTFEYNASSRFKVLDFGLNKYEFRAVHDEGESVMELLVMVSEGDDITIDHSQKRDSFIDSKNMQNQIEDEKSTEGARDFDITTLPQGGEYGNVVELGNGSFTYSDLKGLEIKKAIVGNISCATDASGDYPLSDFVKTHYKSWPYWNTCRDIIPGKGISFFVLRLKGDAYVYERHYLDTNHGLSASYELETGEGVTSKNISAKSKEMKLKNGNFSQLSVVDKLFKKIVE